MRTALVVALLTGLPSGAARASDFQGGPAKIPAISAPVSAAAPAFPLQTGEQFFAGAKKIVDLGGQSLSPWTADVSRRAPGVELHVVNLEPQPLIEDVRRILKAPGLSVAQYDFFKPPRGHPTGERVVLNSPHFGGIYSDAQAARVAEMIDRHLEPGGLFYAHADDMFFTTLHELRGNVLRELAIAELPGGPPKGYKDLSTLIAEREKAVHQALVDRFGKANVSRRRLEGYDRGLLNANESYTYQVRKP